MPRNLYTLLSLSLSLLSLLLISFLFFSFFHKLMFIHRDKNLPRCALSKRRRETFALSKGKVAFP